LGPEKSSVQPAVTKRITNCNACNLVASQFIRSKHMPFDVLENYDLQHGFLCCEMSNTVETGIIRCDFQC
ncbi:peroxisomal membrane MPV17/PMP22-like protein, partial [Planoprotostelium fungivorum]